MKFASLFIVFAIVAVAAIAVIGVAAISHQYKSPSPVQKVTVGAVGDEVTDITVHDKASVTIHQVDGKTTCTFCDAKGCRRCD
jgi:hypothetical protein